MKQAGKRVISSTRLIRKSPSLDVFQVAHSRKQDPKRASTFAYIDGSTESEEHSSNTDFDGFAEGNAVEYNCGLYLNDEPIPSSEEPDVRVETQIPQATAALPPTALAHFLTVLLKVPNVSQAILDFPLNHPLEQHNDDSSLDLGGLSISGGLNYITAELGSEVLNILASGSVKEPEIRLSSEKLRYIYTGLRKEYGYSPRPRIKPAKDCAQEPTLGSEFDINSLVLINYCLNILRADYSMVSYTRPSQCLYHRHTSTTNAGRILQQLWLLP
ncbi:hypothetical protein M431DRAFT_541099 [Trichoderma harzianum CBS 226.95]|uniref:Uncharacterized protein n=1 Tax=Trichoderma harzianum CBS 226.95 TaxID=983964 RepID=A0A2T3ZR60_TRIHA|nr:hypothetical protein M431DRAFT_541099 [Trichoderma harzianum CBS 226.95]PTB47283.1 hypothetical protein M431DRAFT_541099 [Trichoderma harzianum CBS 226.95]